MGGFSVKIAGLKELDAKLTELGGPAAKRTVRDGIRKGGEVMQAAVEERAFGLTRSPYRTARTTALPLDALASDIELRMGVDDDGLPAAIVAPGKYTQHAARLVEYGHRLVKGGYSKKTKSGKTRGPGQEIGDVPPYPFIRPGYEASRDLATEVAVKTIAEDIEKAAAKR